VKRTRIIQPYETALIAWPKPDWKPGDPLEQWPHGFIGVHARAGLRCEVEIESLAADAGVLRITRYIWRSWMQITHPKGSGRSWKQITHSHVKKMPKRPVDSAEKASVLLGEIGARTPPCRRRHRSESGALADTPPVRVTARTVTEDN
jgi:hypothetical protein